MIIEIQTLKSKSELQTAIQKMKIGKIVLYENIDKKGFVEILKRVSTNKSINLIICEVS
jgi:hypothetical protein